MSVTIKKIRNVASLEITEIPRNQVQLRLVSFRFIYFERVSIFNLKLSIEPDLVHTIPNEMVFEFDLFDNDLQVKPVPKQDYYISDGNQLYMYGWNPTLTYANGDRCDLDYIAVFSVFYA